MFGGTFRLSTTAKRVEHSADNEKSARRWRKTHLSVEANNFRVRMLLKKAQSVIETLEIHVKEFDTKLLGVNNHNTKKLICMLLRFAD